MARENFASRLGFILISAGCAVGLGNVWRFPYIVGQYGGATFVLLYLFFLLIFGLPILVCEFAVGRASKFGIARSFDVLEKKNAKWHLSKYVMIAGDYILMMFYTTVSGWMFYYFYKMAFSNDFIGAYSLDIVQSFTTMLSCPQTLVFWMAIATLLGLGVVSLGLEKGVERITKYMMIILLVIMLALAVWVVCLPGALTGVKFYLLPSLDHVLHAEGGFSGAVFAAMGQAFFTLSLGVGSMSIFGSYIGKTHSLFKEAITICLLDTFVAIVAGLIVIPACFAYNLEPGQGPGLIFVTLPNVFSQMPFGRIFGAAFFLFLSFAALSTLIAVFENIVAFWMDLLGCSRKKSTAFNILAILLLSLPCALGFNVLSSFMPFGEGSNVLDLEDFILSNTILPLGSLVFVLFCSSKSGFTEKRFIQEVNTGKGVKFPTNKVMRFYLKYVLPLLVLIILVQGYIQKFS